MPFPALAPAAENNGSGFILSLFLSLRLVTSPVSQPGPLGLPAWGSSHPFLIADMLRI